MISEIRLRNIPCRRLANILFGLISLANWFPIPGQSPAPRTIFGLYGSGRTGRDFVRVMARENGKIGLNLKLYYANGQTCALNKEGEWIGDHLVVAAEGLKENEPCKLEVFFPKGRILFKDEGQRCAQVYCGSRGKLDEVTLPRKR